MPTLDSVGAWIEENILDSKAWTDSDFDKQSKAVIQAMRNLQRWYPETELTDELVSYQSIWEIQGTDPALKYQKQGVKYISDNGERIDYVSRDKVAPDVRDILGAPSYEKEETVVLEGGMLL